MRQLLLLSGRYIHRRERHRVSGAFFVFVVRATEEMRTAQAVQEKEPPVSRTVRPNPPAAVRVPRSTGAGKRRVQPAIKIFKKICVTLLQNTRK